MMKLELFDAAIDKWAANEDIAAENAHAAGDERAYSIALMKNSMYTTMLKTLGHNAPHALKKCASDLEALSEKSIALDDADAADRISIQLACIRQVQDLITELGGNL